MDTNNMNCFSYIRGVIRNYSELIDDISEKIGSVGYIANKTNLLAINATIEVIHASDLLSSFEQIVGNNLLIQARLLAKIIEYDPDFMYQDGSNFAGENGIEEFYVTDGSGIIEFTSYTAKKGTDLNSPALFQILENPEAAVIMPATSNCIDKIQYKVVTTGRTDKPGLIQFASHFIRPSGQAAIDGFGVVAKEAKRLADLSRETSSIISSRTKEIIDKITGLSDLIDNLNEAVIAKSQIETLQDSLNELRQSFRNILMPLSDLIIIARQTSLLGVRASIEAAQSSNEKQEFDDLLDTHMAIEAKLTSLMIERIPDTSCEELVSLTDHCGISEIWITDQNGVVEFTNVDGGIGFAFSNEGQTAPFMAILNNPDAVVTQPPSYRDIDGQVYKYAGVGRRGKGGICQIGNPSKLYGDSTAKGFSEVSKQIKTLAEQSKQITAEIEEIIEEMDAKAKKAIDSLIRLN